MPITLSCGHDWPYPIQEAADVSYASEDCDAIDGFMPAIFYGTYCWDCATALQHEGILFKSDEEADAWLDAQPAPP